MFYKILHNRIFRIFGAIFGEFIMALSMNLFIVPLNLYAGGVTGVAQLLSTLLETYGGMNFGNHNVAGLLYFLFNIPLLLYGYRTLGKALTFRTAVCSISFSIFYSILPTPSVPIVSDYLTACLLGGILTGLGCGIVLTCGCSNGGLDVIGLCLSKRGSNFTIGRFSLTFNIFLYAICLILFIPEIAIYSMIYNFFSTTVLDRFHKQNINVQALIFTHNDPQELENYITEQLGRGVTYWSGIGAYTNEDVQIMCVVLSQYEVEELLHTVHSIDPKAFITVQSGTQIYGNFRKKLE